jgi:hypothetical protein
MSPHRRHRWPRVALASAALAALLPAAAAQARS